MSDQDRERAAFETFEAWANSQHTWEGGRPVPTLKEAWHACAAAKDAEIARLEAEIARLREALAGRGKALQISQTGLIAIAQTGIFGEDADETYRAMAREAFEASVSAAPPEKDAENWQPIETAPEEWKDGRDVLVFCPDTKEQFVAYPSKHGNGAWIYARSTGLEIVCQPTHIRPLPPAPREG